MKISLYISSFILFLTLGISAQNATNIRNVDFENFTFLIEKKTVRMTDGLQRGACSKKDIDGLANGDIWNVLPDNIAYGDLDGDGKEEAMVPLIANICSGNMITNEALLVYTIKNGKAVQMPIFNYYDEGCKAGEKACNFARNPGITVEYDAAEKALVIETYFGTSDDSSCCPSLSRKTWYKWNGTKFVETKKGKIEKKIYDE